MADASPSGPLAVINQLKELWGRQPRKRKTLAVVVLVGVLGVVALTTLGKREASWTVLSEGASPDDAQELISTLQARHVPARIREGKLEVPAGQVDQARAIAAAAGLPRAGKGFELFDGSNLGQSSFTEQVNYRRALQGELARSIAALAQVQGARVHLALGKKSVFKDQSEPASASVALHLHAAQTLSAEQVRGVRQLVASSVEGLKADAVVVVDSHGNLLDTADPSSSDRRAEIERTMTTRVRSMLERVVGAGKVSVVTTAVVDDRKVSETQELYDNANPALRSESRVVEGTDATAGIGGVAGARGNLPGAPAATATPGAPEARRLQETKNYEISRTVRQTTKPEVQLQKLYLAVLVDYKTDAEGKPVARTDKELGELAILARHAAGIDDARGDKIEVRSIPFVPDAEIPATAASPAAAEFPLVPIAIGGGAALLVLIVIGFLILRRNRDRRTQPSTLALPAPIADLERVLEARTTARAPTLAGMPEQRGLPEGKPIRDRVIDVVRADVERTAEVLTAWLSEPPPRGAKP